MAHFLFRITEHVLESAVAKNYSAFDAEKTDADLGIVEDGAEELFVEQRAPRDIFAHATSLQRHGIQCDATLVEDFPLLAIVTMSNHEESWWMTWKHRAEKLRTVTFDGSQRVAPYRIVRQLRARGPGKQTSLPPQPGRVLSALVEKKGLERTGHPKGDLNEDQKCSNNWGGFAVCDDNVRAG
jgi:hypothetical protein